MSVVKSCHHICLKEKMVFIFGRWKVASKSVIHAQ